MSRYPFNDRIGEFIELTSGCSIDRNRLLNIGRIMHLMKENGTIQSDNPSRITLKDVQRFVAERGSGGVSESTIYRDLSYLDDYLKFHDNCAVEEYLEDIRNRNLEERRRNSEKAIRKIFLHNSKDVEGKQLVKAYAFVMLAIVFDIHPDMLRKAKLRNTFENGRVNNCHIIFIDRSGTERDERLNSKKLPVVQKYIDRTYPLDALDSTPRPLFPSSNPLFDHISPDESRELKALVEKDIGIVFDYTQCTAIYLDMLQDDSIVQSIDPPTRNIGTPPMRRSTLLDRLLGR